MRVRNGFNATLMVLLTVNINVVCCVGSVEIQIKIQIKYEMRHL